MRKERWQEILEGADFFDIVLKSALQHRERDRR